MNPNIFRSFKEAGITVFSGLIYTLAGLYGSTWLFTYLDRKYDWIKDIWKRLIIGLISVEVWGLLIYISITAFLLFAFGNISGVEIINQVKSNIAYPLIMSVLGMMIIAVTQFFSN